MEVTEQEFLNIIEENKRRMKHLCRTYANGREERKDLYQEMILQVWHSLPGFNGDAKLSTWIYRIGVNTAITFMRKKKTRKEYYEAYKEQKSNDRDAVEIEFEEDKQVGQLYKAISTLNASEKAIISMYLEEFSYEQIAYAMNITENYVGVKLNRIKKKLSSILGDEYGT